jgi:hypothetical protein
MPKVALVMVTVAILLIPASALHAHCDAVDGPVAADARRALEIGDLTPALKWVYAEQEIELSRAFDLAASVRAAGGENRELADLWFVETAVRLHRLSEGAPYEGLKPAGIDYGPAIRAADAAIGSGSLEALEHLLVEGVTDGLHRRFEAAMEARHHAEETTEAGRRWVAAYAELVHFAQRAWESIGQEGDSHDPQHSH